MVPMFFQYDYWWPKGISGLYRPVAVLSFWLNYSINHALGNDPLDPFQYHVVNFFLHWFTACLAFVLLRQLTKHSPWRSCCVLFVTHPIATESVSNIIGRSDILVAISVFACLTLYIRSLRVVDFSGGRQWRMAPWLVPFIVVEVILGLLVAASPSVSTPSWLESLCLLIAIAGPVGALVAIFQEGDNLWASLTWILPLIAVEAAVYLSRDEQSPTPPRRLLIRCSPRSPGIYRGAGWSMSLRCCCWLCPWLGSTPSEKPVGSDGPISRGLPA